LGLDFVENKKMKRKIIHPRLAAGICLIIFLLFFEILERITNFQFISKYVMFLCIIFIPVGIFVYIIFNATYDRKRNDDKLFIIVGLIVFVLFLAFCFLF
jgi:hypothetical protein